ncbi:MAG: glycoside hydrolase family 2 protein [Armatimonadota bacterium]
MFRPFVALTLLILAMTLSSAAKERSSAPVAAEPCRVAVSLDASWSFAVDATGQAPADAWANALPSPDEITLPHSWKITGHGAAWYAREVTFPGAGPVDVLLNLDHPVGTLDVFLDGQPVAQFAGNGLPQSLHLQGEGGSAHHLALRLRCAGLSSSTRQEPIYGLGHISMELLPPVRIDALTAVMDPQKKTLTARYRLFTAAPASAGLKLEVLSADGKRSVDRHQETMSLPAAGVSGEKVFTIKRMLGWSPREPGNSYRVRATLLVAGKAVDMRELTCGACAATVTDDGLQINGQPLQLKGVRLPGGIPMRYRPAEKQAEDTALVPTLEETIRRELELAKRAGFNAIMADGSALPEEVLAAADALGVLVVGEIPLNEGDTPLIRETLEVCAQHPCIVAWSWAGTGDQAGRIADLRALDPSRPILLRDGAQSRLIGPRQMTGQVVADLDLNLPVARAESWWNQLQQLEGGRRPVLATGIGIEMTATNGGGIRGNTAEGDEALCLLRSVVESLRSDQYFSLLGYFVRLPEAETLTGLSTPEGNPTNALTTSLAYNASCAIVMRVKPAVDVSEQTILDAAIVCDDRLQGDYQLYQVVTTPADGATAITTHELELTGKSEQYDLLKYLSFAPDRAGEYRLQLVLSQDDRVIASTQVARITVSSTEVASLASR